MTDATRSFLPAAAGAEPGLGRCAARLVEALLVLVIVATPLYFDVDHARPFEALKVALVRTIALVALWALAVRVIESLRRSPVATRARLASGLGRALRDPLVLAILFVVLSWSISTALALAPRVSAWGSYTRLSGLYSLLCYVALAVCTAACLPSRAAVERLVSAMILASVPVALLGIAQRYGLDPFGLMRDPRRVAASLGAPNFAGSYVALVLPLTMVRFIGALAAGGAAAHAFALSLQGLLLVFTQSRGPLLGILGAGFVLGLCALLHLRGATGDRARLRVGEFARGCAEVLRIAALGAIGGALGLSVGWGLEQLPSDPERPLAGLAALGLGAGTLVGCGMGLALTLRAPARRRVAFVTWLMAGGGLLLFVGALNLRGTPLDVALDPLRRMPLLGRLAKSGETQGGSVQVRLLIWEAALRLIGKREPLGIAGSEFAPPDARHALRSFVGYGPDSLYDVFPAVEPPGLAYLETRGSVADRAHNETIDALIMTGFIGALANWLLWGALLARFLALLGWLPDRMAGLRWAACALGGAGAGALAAYVYGGGWTLVPLAAPLGLIAGSVLFLALQGVRAQPAQELRPMPLLELGLFGALCSYLIQMHFVFPIAVTHASFWIGVGLLFVLERERDRVDPPAAVTGTAMLARGLVVGVVALVLVAALLRRPDMGSSGRDAWVLCAILAITWLVSLGSSSVVGLDARGVGLHALGALCGAALAFLLVGMSATNTEDALGRATALSFAYVGLLVALLLLAVGMALAHARMGARDPRAWLLHAPLAIGIGLFAWHTNVDPMRAGFFLEAGEREARQARWASALTLHERARALEPAVDRYALASARAHQGLALDPRTPAAERAAAWRHGEEAARAARRIDPYNPDNSANLGRFLHSLAAAGDPTRFAAASAAFDDALALAPNQVEFHLLAARAVLALGDPGGAIERLERAAQLDPAYAATWVLLGDVQLAIGEPQRALAAHASAWCSIARGNDGIAAFADEGLDARLRAVDAAGALEQWLAALGELESERPDDARIPWLIGRALLLEGAPARALPFLERAAWQGAALEAVRDLAGAHLATGSLAEAERLYTLVVEQYDDLEAQRGLARALERAGRDEEAILRFTEVLRHVPRDAAALRAIAELHRRAGRAQRAAHFEALAAEGRD